MEVSLRDHLSERIADLRAYIDTRFSEVEKSTSLASSALGQRLNGMNEFRLALKDASSLTMSRTEITAALDRMQITIDELNKSRWTLAGMASQKSVTIAMVISIASLIISVLKIFV